MSMVISGDGSITGLVAGGLPSATVTQTTLATSVIPLGVGQTWQNVLASRSFSVTYTNSTGRPIMVYVGAAASGNSFIYEGVNLMSGSQSSSASPNIFITFIVPDGGTYNLQNQGSVFTPNYWRELR
jgi:hypothetical protein